MFRSLTWIFSVTNEVEGFFFIIIIGALKLRYATFMIFFLSQEALIGLSGVSHACHTLPLALC